jgi:hypothetical protein
MSTAFLLRLLAERHAASARLRAFAQALGEHVSARRRRGALTNPMGQGVGHMQKVNRRSRGALLAMVAACTAGPAFAGLPNLTNALNWLQALFAGIAVATVTVAGTWVGFETLHRGAQWEDVKRIVIGATIIGAMSTIAAVLV